MRTTFRNLLGLGLVATASLLTACDDGPSGVDEGVGVLSFALDGGGVSRQFSAQGRLPVGSTATRPFAGALHDETGYLLLAFDRAGGSIGDVSFLFLPQVATGDELIFDADVCLPTEPEGDLCAYGFVVLDTDMSESGETPGDTQLSMIDGTVRITEVTAEVIRGTFSGLAVVQGTETDPNPEFVEVEGGSFTLPVVEDDAPSITRARARLLR